MKKKNLKSLQLNKKAISNLKGGSISSCITTSNYWVPTEIYTEFMCGDTLIDDNETIGAFCGFRTYEADSCGC